MKFVTNDKRNWHEFYVLWPRKVGNTWVWLETIYRRKVGFFNPYWDYTWEKK